MSPPSAPLPRLAVLASGSGRSVENLVEVTRSGALAAEVALVVTDRDGIGVLERCARLEVPTRVLPWNEVGGAAGFSAAAFDLVRGAHCELVVLAGFLRLLHVPPDFEGRVLNIHPSLLPAFGGKGFYGDRVHAAVLASGAEETGCTVHYVDEQYDHGRPLLQRRVPVLEGDTVATLAARVFEAEREALPAAIAIALEGSRRGAR